MLAAASGLMICANSPTAFAIDAKQLDGEFSKNEEGAKRKYLGKTVTVTGAVSFLHLDSDLSGVPRGPKISMKPLWYFIQCWLDAAGKERALSLSQGDTATITGTLHSAGGEEINLYPCSLE